MWQAFKDGLSILSENWLIVSGVVGSICLGGILLFFALRDKTQEKDVQWQNLLLLAVFFILSLILRLAFIAQTYVPPYFDSVEHVRLTDGLVTALKASTLPDTVPALIPNYYHLVFHFLASLLTFGLRANAIEVILALGQVILAAIPLPLFFLIRRETHSDTAAFFGIILAGYGWYMPGFAVNWGKYPALAGLLAIEIVLSIAYFISQNKLRQPLMITLLILSTLLATLIHTRTLVVIAISFAGWFVANRMPNCHKKFQYLLLGWLLLGIFILGLLIRKETLLDLTLEPYLDTGMWVTLIVVLLIPFARHSFPWGVYFCLIFIMAVFAALFIPVDAKLVGFEQQTLLDRPFVEMLLYFPLSILGALGLAGLGQFLGTMKAVPEKIPVLISVLFVVILGSLLISGYDFYPSDCCTLVRYDDTVAMDWLDKNTPVEARILTAAMPINVLPSGPSTDLVGTDAGIWIPALTDRSIILMPFNIDFRSQSTLERLCQMQIDYVYVGGTAQKFNASQMQAKAEWYTRVLFLPSAQLYQLTGCIQ